MSFDKTSFWEQDLSKLAVLYGNVHICVLHARSTLWTKMSFNPKKADTVKLQKSRKWTLLYEDLNLNPHRYESTSTPVRHYGVSPCRYVTLRYGIIIIIIIIILL